MTEKQGAVRPGPPRFFSETDIMREAMVEASRRGHRLWRNNVAAFRDAHGNVIKTGLAKGSADTIGIRRDGRFLSIEFKRPGWRPPRSSGKALERHEMQVRWQNMIRSLNGLAGFAISVEEAMAIIEGGSSDGGVGGDAAGD